jgi:ubiquinone/menaquinone biosynthesis C-methylase UbiE
MADKKVDWTDERRRRIVEEQRKFLWTPEQLERLAAWMGLESGLTMLDLGCGYGYVGRTYAPFISPGGRVVCVDREAALLEEARRRAADEKADCSFEFLIGDAYSVPLAEGAADVACCQTLLIHLKEPEKCLAEMVRVVRPGGVVVCNEPNNSPVNYGYISTYVPGWEEAVEDAADEWRVYFGRKALGRGDAAVGGRVPEMMHKLGLVDVDARLNEKVNLLVPPYETPFQRHFKDTMIRNLEKRDEWEEELRELFLAGRGDEETWEKNWEKGGRLAEDMKKALEQGEFYMTGSPIFYSIRGRKPAK